MGTCRGREREQAIDHALVQPAEIRMYSNNQQTCAKAVPYEDDKCEPKHDTDTQHSRCYMLSGFLCEGGTKQNILWRSRAGARGCGQAVETFECAEGNELVFEKIGRDLKCKTSISGADQKGLCPGTHQ